MPSTADPGITRRRLIAGLGAAATVPLWPRPASADPGMSVAIVGGGIAGLVALDILANAGIDATLYEARAICGGRIRSVTGALGDGIATDDGGQLVNTDHADIRQMCGRFDLALTDRQTGKSRDVLIGQHATTARAMRPLAVRIARDARAVDGSASASSALDALSARAYLDRIGARGQARHWIEQTIRTEYGVEPEAASALELVWNLPSVDGEDVEVIGGSDERYVIEGGSQKLTDALATLHAGRIRTRAVLKRVGQAGARLSLDFADGTRAEADRVILAVPVALYRSIAFDVGLPQLWRRFMAEVDLGRVEKLVVGCSSRPWQAAIGPAGAVWGDTGFAEAWDASAGQPEIAGGAFAFLPGGAQIDAFAGADMRALSERWCASAEGVVPGLTASRNGRLRRTAWHADPFARGAYVNFAPGQLTRFAPLLWSDDGGGRVGRLLFAGEHMSDAFPGYMNGAAETGRRAAASVLAEVAKG